MGEEEREHSWSMDETAVGNSFFVSSPITIDNPTQSKQMSPPSSQLLLGMVFGYGDVRIKLAQT
jgi:hypothetical protein